MLRMQATSDDGKGTTAIDNGALTALAEQLRVVSETLLINQAETARVKAESEKAQADAAEAKAYNYALQLQLDAQIEKRSGGYRFKHMGTIV